MCLCISLYIIVYEFITVIIVKCMQDEQSNLYYKTTYTFTHLHIVYEYVTLTHMYIYTLTYQHDSRSICTQFVCVELLSLQLMRLNAFALLLANFGYTATAKEPPLQSHPLCRCCCCFDGKAAVLSRQHNSWK